MKLQLEIDGYAVAGGAAIYVFYRAACARAGYKQAAALESTDSTKRIGDDFCELDEASDRAREATSSVVVEPEAEPKTPTSKEERSCFEGAVRWPTRRCLPLLLVSLLAVAAALLLADGDIPRLRNRARVVAKVALAEQPGLGAFRQGTDACNAGIDGGACRDAVPTPLVSSHRAASELSDTALLLSSGQAAGQEAVGAGALVDSSDAGSRFVKGVEKQAGEIIRVQLSRQHGTSRDGDTLVYKSAYYGTLDIGSPAVPFTFVFDTGSGHLVLPSTFCRTAACKVHKRYQKSASKSARDIDYDGSRVLPGQPRDQLTVQFGTGDITGVFVEDRICLETKLTSGIEAPAGRQGSGTRAGCVNMRFVSAIEMSPEPFSTFEFDGILGLGLDSLSQTPEFNFIHQMATAAGMGWQNGPPIFAIFLAGDSHETSELSLGGIVEEHLEDEVRWNPVLDPENGHWMVKVKSLRVDGEVLPFCENGCKAVVDSGTALLAVPSASFSEIYRGLWHTGSLDGECNGHGPQLQFELEDLTITLGPEDYARPEKYKVPRNYQSFGKPETRRNDLYCRPLLMSMDMEEPIGPKLFILGEPVLRKYYTVYDAKAKRVGLGLAKHTPLPEASPSVDDSDDEWFYEHDTDNNEAA